METAQRKLWMKQWEGLRKGRAQMGEGETQKGRGSVWVGLREGEGLSEDSVEDSRSQCGISRTGLPGAPTLMVTVLR